MFCPFDYCQRSFTTIINVKVAYKKRATKSLNNQRDKLVSEACSLAFKVTVKCCGSRYLQWFG